MQEDHELFSYVETDFLREMANYIKYRVGKGRRYIPLLLFHGAVLIALCSRYILMQEEDSCTRAYIPSCIWPYEMPTSSIFITHICIETAKVHTDMSLEDQFKECHQELTTNLREYGSKQSWCLEVLREILNEGLLHIQ